MLDTVDVKISVQKSHFTGPNLIELYAKYFVLNDNWSQNGFSGTEFLTATVLKGSLISYHKYRYLG